MNDNFDFDLSMDDVLTLATLKTLDELDSSEMNLVHDGSLYDNDILKMTEHNSDEISKQFAIQLNENFMFYAQKEFLKQQKAAKSVKNNR